ncbi:LPD38 domain-containing protein [Pseudoalteromonas sp. 1181_04]|uniref:LPD38 domain-containing protein n=1 Tax=Pseudoalteromonas sp. 1181_04 TaxID=2604450 RepID=UPI004062A7B2
MTNKIVDPFTNKEIEFIDPFADNKTESGMAAAFGAGVDKVQELGYRAVKGFTDVGETGSEQEGGSIAQSVANTVGQGGALSKWAQEGIDRNVKEQEAYKPTVGSYKDISGLSDLGSYTGELVAGSIPYMAGAATGVGAFGMAGGLSNEAYEKQPEGEKDEVKAVASGAGQMLLERLGIKVSMGQLGKDILKDGVFETAKRMGKGELIDAVRDPSFAKRIFKGAVGEGLTESGQEALAQWGAGKSLDEINGLDEAFVGGFVVGGAMRAGSESAQKVMGYQQKTAEAVKDGVDQLVEAGTSPEEAIETVKKQQYDSAIKQGLSDVEASAIVARTMKEKFGIDDPLFAAAAEPDQQEQVIPDDNSTPKFEDNTTSKVDYDAPTAARQAGFDQTAKAAGQYGDMLTSPAQQSLKALDEGNNAPTVDERVKAAAFDKSPTPEDRFSPIKYQHEGELLSPEAQRAQGIGNPPIDGQIVPEQGKLPTTEQTKNREMREQAQADLESQPKSIEKKNIIFGEDGRPQQRAAERVKQAGKDSQNLLPQKDIVFAGNESGVNVAKSGEPFKTKRDALLSKEARAARRAGKKTKAVSFDNGFGWTVKSDASTAPNTAPDISADKQQADATLTDEGTIPQSNETIDETNTQPTANLAGDPIDGEWTAFSQQSETKNIPRSEMPQIKAENRGAMVNFMNARDISHEQGEVPASSLKPTQQEFSPAKVKKAMEFEGGNRSILVSNDNYVLDGHHQWLAAREKGEPVKVIRLNAPIEQLVPLAKEMPSTETQDDAGKLTTTGNEETATTGKLNGDNGKQSEQKAVETAETGKLIEQEPATTEQTNELPPILKTTKRKWLQSQVKEQGLKKGSPGFDVAMAKIEESYEPAIDKALAESSFEIYQQFNSDTPESINRQAYNELRKEFGYDKAPPPDAIKPNEDAEPPKSGFSLPETLNADGMTADEIEAVINKTKNELANTKTEDWGNLRGQGKRTGGMVMGGMRDSSLQGEKSYLNPIGKLDDVNKADYDDAIATFNDNSIAKSAYGKARSAGFDHDTSLRYGLSKVADIGMTFSELLKVAKQKDKVSEKPANNKSSNDQEAVKQENIDDFGEKLGGARKDVWGGFSEAIQDQQNTAELPLSKSWPEPNYRELANNGVSGEAIALIAAMRSEVPSKPRLSYKVSRWSEKVNTLKSFAADLMNGEREITSVMQRMRNHSSKLAAIVDAVPPIAKADLDTLKSVADYRISSGSFSVFGGKKYSPNKVFYFIERNGRPVYDGASETLSDVQALLAKVIKANQADASNATGGKKSKISVYRDRYTKDIYLGWNGASGVLKIKSFDDLGAARDYLKNNREEVEQTLQKIKETPNMRKPINAERIGPDRYAENVTPETFGDAFGFRGVEFGNWVEQAKRQKDLNQAYDGLMDLAEALDLPPKALSLNGQLGLAFGARGKGGKNPAAAHYEPNSVVINLTKKAGSGSLAHEWWHALDNYFGKQKSRGEFITDMPYSMPSDEIRPEMASAFKHVRNAIVQSGLPERSKQLDARRSKAYWATPIEMTARSFETYIIDKLNQQGISNDYLANVVGDEAWTAAESLGFESDNTYPYPNKAEQEKINPAYQTLFDTIESENTNEGIRLFSKSKKTANSKSISTEQAQSIADQFVKSLKGANGITVSILDDTATAEKLWRMSLDGATVKGAYSEKTKTVFVIAENINDVTDLKQTLAHETIAHGGLDTVIGADAKQEFIDRIKKTKGRKAFDKYWKDANNDYWDGSLDVKAEEIFARFVESEPSKGELKYWWNALKRFIRAQLDKVGLAYSEDTELTAMREMLESIVKGFKAQQTNSESANSEFAYSQSEKKLSKTADADTRTAKEKLGLVDQARKTLAEKAKERTKEVVDILKSSPFWDRLNEGIFDGLAGIKNAEQSVGINDVNKMGYVSARLAAGVSDVLHGVFNYGAPMWKDGIIQRKEDTKGLLEVFGMVGDDLNDWLAWMGAHRAEKLKAQGRENNLTTADINELKALANGKEKLFEQTRQEYNKVNSAILDVAQGSGLISKAQRSGFDEEYYVPFFRDMGETDPEMDAIKRSIIEPHTRKGIAGQSAQVKELKGGVQSTKDLLQNIITRQSTLIEASLKNKAMQEVVSNLNGTDYMTHEKSDEAKSLTQEQLNKISKVRVMIDGEPQAYLVSDPALMRSLIQINSTGSQNIVNKIGRSAKRFLTAGITLSPDFIAKNFIRDAAHAWMINKDGFKFGTDSYKGLKKAFKEDEAYRDLIFSGAAFQGGYIHGADPEAAAQQTRRALRAKGLTKNEVDGYMGSLITNGKQLLETYRNISDKVENANRLSTYEASLANNKSKREAAFNAKDLMDYSLKGNFTTINFLIDMLPFFNARLQGMSKLIRASKAGDNDRVLKVLSANLAAKGAKVAGLSLALAMYNDDDERYQELPDWDKDANWHVFAGDEHWRIPKPFELGIVFGTLPERLFNYGAGNQTGKDLQKSIMHAALTTMALNPTPQFMLPLVETALNRSFFRDAPIEGMADQNKQAEDRYSAHTSDIAIAIGKQLGWSPKKIEHVIKGYTGTIGSYVLGASDMLARQVMGKETADTPLNRYPVIKAFYQGDRPKGSTKFADEFYDALDTANQAYGSYKRAIELGDNARIQEIVEKEGQKLQSKSGLAKIQRVISKIGKAQKAVNDSQRLTGAQKREQLDELQRQKNAVYHQAYVAFNLREW